MTIVHGQLMPFSLSAPNDADYCQLSVIDSNAYYAVTKLKGLGGGKSEYVLEKYDDQFQKNWRLPIDLNKNQNIIGFESVNKNLLVFIGDHDLDKSVSKLIVNVYSREGKVLFDHVLAFENSIGSWQETPEKGQVSETVKEKIASIQPIGFVSPSQFRFHIKTSPDASCVLLYRYIQDQKGLISQVKRFDQNMNLLNVGLIPIDRGFTTYGFEPTNSSKIYLYKSNRSGKVAVIQYDLKTNESVYLALEGASSQRDNLKLVLESENRVCLYKLNKQVNALSGVSYSVFDFNKNEILPTAYYEISDAQKQTLHDLEAAEYFQIEETYLTPGGERLVVLENQRVEVGGNPLESNRTSNPKHWNSAAVGSIVTGPLFLVLFDDNGVAKWSKLLTKSQKVSHTDGINSASTMLNISGNSMELVYAFTSKGLFLNQLHYTKANLLNGEVTVDKNISNPEKLVVARPYCGWRPRFGGGFVFVGKKGLLGKKSFIKEINFN